jgi:RimJ/RimL family protein N-acetyltransferase
MTVQVAAPSRSMKSVELPDGRTVDVRPIRVADRPLLRQAFNRLGPESRYRRFLAPVHELSEAMLSHFTDVDHHDHEAIVAVSRPDGRIVGGARYVRLPSDPTTADVAVTVVDAWQRRGLGTELVTALAERAVQEAITDFSALVASDNAPVTRLLQKFSGSVRVTGRSGDTVDYAIAITEILDESKLRRAASTYPSSPHTAAVA